MKTEFEYISWWLNALMKPAPPKLGVFEVLREGTMKWDWSLEGTTCPTCHGTTWAYEQGDLHRSSGHVPCPKGYFQGHGNPTCRDGKLHFSDYDRQNEKRLRAKEA